MKILTGFAILSCLLSAGLSTATAQTQPSGATPPPRVFVIQREFLKPGKAGSAHQKTESAFVQAFQAATWPQHYLGMDSLSGRSRAIFLTGYDSLAAWQKDLEATQNDASLAAALDSALMADGELLDAYESGTFVRRDDLSFQPGVDIAHMRYMRITMIQVRPGHANDFETLNKMHTSAMEKLLPDSHWATYQDVFGHESGGKYIILSPMKSLAEADQWTEANQQFASGTDADQMKIASLMATTIQSLETNLFRINPRMSYAPDSWVKADPDFWGQK